MTCAQHSKFVPICRIVDGSSTRYGSSDRSYAQRESACMRQWERRQDFDRFNIRSWIITLGSAFDSLRRPRKPQERKKTATLSWTASLVQHTWERHDARAVPLGMYRPSNDLFSDRVVHFYS